MGQSISPLQLEWSMGPRAPRTRPGKPRCFGRAELLAGISESERRCVESACGWTVVRVEDRAEYLSALDRASIEPLLLAQSVDNRT